MKKILLILLVCISSNAFAQWNKSVVDNGIISNDTIYIESVSFQNYLNDGDTILAHVYGYVVSDSEEFAYCIFDSTANIFLIDSVVLNYYGTQDAVNFPSDTGVAYVTVQYWYNYADLLFDNDSGGSSIADMPPYPHDSTLFLRGDSTWGLPLITVTDIDSVSIGDSIYNSVNYAPLISSGTHHLAQSSLIGSTNKIYVAHGISSSPTFEDGGTQFLLHVPNVSYPNLIEPVTSGIPPLSIKTATLSDTNAFEVYRYDATKFFIVDSGGIVNTYRGFNLNTSANPIGLDTGGALDYGQIDQMLTSKGPGLTDHWQYADSLVSGLEWRIQVGTGSRGFYQMPPALNGFQLVQSRPGLYPYATETPQLGAGGHVNGGALTFNGYWSGGITQRAADTTASYTIYWPNAQGAASTYLKNDGSGNLSWNTVSSGVSIGDAIGGGSTGSILYIDGSGHLAQDQNNLYYDPSPNGNLAVGSNGNGTTSMFSVGPSFQFQVNSSGDLVKLKNVDYTFPSSQGAANTVLQNDGSGNLSWAGVSDVHNITVSLDSTQIRNLIATPVTLIAAPGTNKVLIPLRVMFIYRGAGNTPYTITSTQDLKISWNGSRIGSGIKMDKTFLHQATDQLAIAGEIDYTQNGTNDLLSNYENQPLTITQSSGSTEYSVGNAPVKVQIFYWIMSTN